MNVNALLVGTLDSLLPTADSVYKGAATEYIVFNYTELPADFADDDAAHYRYLVQVHLYAPLEKNTPHIPAGNLSAARGGGLYPPDGDSGLR